MGWATSYCLTIEGPQEGPCENSSLGHQDLSHGQHIIFRQINCKVGGHFEYLDILDQ